MKEDISYIKRKRIAKRKMSHVFFRRWTRMKRKEIVRRLYDLEIGQTFPEVVAVRIFSLPILQDFAFQFDLFALILSHSHWLLPNKKTIEAILI